MIIILSKPLHGWSKLKIGDFEERFSYLTDVPEDCLNAFIGLFETNRIQTIYFDAEGFDYYVIFHPIHIERVYIVIILLENNNAKVFSYYIAIKNLAKELLNDLKTDYQEWCKWTWLENKLKDYSSLIEKLEYILDL